MYWLLEQFEFYNSYLPEIAAEEDRDRISAKGFSMGYIGSVLLQIICFVLLFKQEWFGLKSDGQALQISFLLVGVWWFSLLKEPCLFCRKVHQVLTDQIKIFLPMDLLS
jgi:UMF1 family MFS transporter